MKILITGIAGSGKTTHAKMLAEDLGLCFLTTGMFHKLASQDTKLGRTIKMALEKGSLFDDQLVADLVKDRLSKKDCLGGFVSDSYPRYVGQLKYFDPILDIIFYLKISIKEAVNRTLKRKREDDTLVAIQNRISWQIPKTAELVDYFRNKIPIFEINAQRNIKEVHKDILSHIK